MKMNKKKVLSLTLVIVLIAILSFGTLAWFNDADKVTNTFYVASSEDETPDSADKIFSVDVWENVDTDGDGELDDTDGDGTPDKIDQGATFEDILPGAHIAKAPYVENTGSYDQYVRLIITFKSAKSWYTLFKAGDLGGPMNMLTLDANFYTNWVQDDDWFTYDEVNDTYTYVYYLSKPLSPKDVVATFTAVNIPGELVQADVVDMGAITLDVRADAVQVENLPDSVINAKQAFDFVEWAAGAEY